MKLILRVAVGSVTGLLAGEVIGLMPGIVLFLPYHVYLNLTIESRDTESLGPLFSIFAGGAMGLAVGIPTGLIVGAAIGIYTRNVTAIVVAVSAGVITCAATLVVGNFIPPLGNTSVVVDGTFIIGIGALAGVAAGVFSKDRLLHLL